MNETRTAAKELDFEQVLLSHVELCYSVGFALTRDPNRAAALAKEVLLWAWRNEGGAWDAASIKRVLLSELRDRHLRHNRDVRLRSAYSQRQTQGAGV